MFLKLTSFNNKKPVLVPVDNIAMILPLEEGSFISTKWGSSVQVRQALHQIEGMLNKAGTKCIGGL